MVCVFFMFLEFIMFKTNDEKINGFLFVIVLPLLLFAMSYYGFESSYTRLKTSETTPDFLFSSVYAYRVIPNYLSVQMTDLMYSLINGPLSFFKDFRYFGYFDYFAIKVSLQR